MKKDLALLGFRGSRVHDSRRTFISLALADGADKHKLRWVTHGPENDIMDLYTTLPWKALCEQVAVLKIQRRSGVPPIPRNPASAQEAAPAETDELLQCCYRRSALMKKPPSLKNLGAVKRVPRAGFEAVLRPSAGIAELWKCTDFLSLQRVGRRRKAPAGTGV